MNQRDDQTAGDRWDRLLNDLASHPIEEGWVTLEEAVDATGVSRSTCARGTAVDASRRE